jgi:SP family general alpha glucoside:H+ symporter-like MFS transporter
MRLRNFWAAAECHSETALKEQTYGELRLPAWSGLHNKLVSQVRVLMPHISMSRPVSALKIPGILQLECPACIGRRRLYLYGLFVSAVTLIIAGSIGARPETPAQSWAVGSLLIFLTFIYDLTVGPVCYILVAEIPSTRLRAKTVVLARVAYNVVSIITNTITARMLNPTAWNLKGKSCFFNLGITILCLIWCYWRLPETFGLSYLEIDILFEKKANVSKFRELRAALDSMGYFSLSNDERQGSIWRGY